MNIRRVFVEGGGAAIPTGRIARTGGGDGRQGREANPSIANGAEVEREAKRAIVGNKMTHISKRLLRELVFPMGKPKMRCSNMHVMIMPMHLWPTLPSPAREHKITGLKM